MGRKQTRKGQLNSCVCCSMPFVFVCPVAPNSPHNPKVGGSNPPPATNGIINLGPLQMGRPFLLCLFCDCSNLDGASRPVCASPLLLLLRSSRFASAASRLADRARSRCCTYRRCCASYGR